MIDINGQQVDEYETLMRNKSFWDGVTAGSLAVGIPMVAVLTFVSTFIS